MRRMLPIGFAAMAAVLFALAGGPAIAAMIRPEPAEETTDKGLGVKALEKGDFEDAIASLAKADAATPGDADILAMLGYAHRKLKQYNTALGYYAQAIAADPDHKAAHEYLGELYVEVGETAKAEGELARLAEICGTDCKEYKTLKDFLAGVANDGALKRLY